MIRGEIYITLANTHLSRKRQHYRANVFIHTLSQQTSFCKRTFPVIIGQSNAAATAISPLLLPVQREKSKQLEFYYQLGLFQGRLQLSGKSYLEFLWFPATTFWDWSRKLRTTYSTNQMHHQPRLASVFPRLTLVTCIWITFLFVLVFYVPNGKLLSLFGFYSYKTRKGSKECEL